MVTSTWHRTKVPPLRADIDRRLREFRRAEARAERFGLFTLAALLGTAFGTLAAFITPGVFS